jgi:hypothetical protein
MQKDYQSLTSHRTHRKELIGVHTASGITYSSLSMGAGEQRLVKILTTVFHAEPYSLILIDEIDLLLHCNARKRLIRKSLPNGRTFKSFLPPIPRRSASSRRIRASDICTIPGKKPWFTIISHRISSMI